MVVESVVEEGAQATVVEEGAQATRITPSLRGRSGKGRSFKRSGLRQKSVPKEPPRTDVSMTWATTTVASLLSSEPETTSAASYQG